MQLRFVDPITKRPLGRDSAGNLQPHDRQDSGSQIYRHYDGSYDFVNQSSRHDERAFYDHKYGQANHSMLSMKSLKKKWSDDFMTGSSFMLQSLGDLNGKCMLLLGNGTSSKEFFFLTKGAEFVFTDLSFQAVMHMRRLFTQSDFYTAYKQNIAFHAVDAFHLPFDDNSYDIIYSFGFVHHLDDLETFFREVSRCLKPGGVCRFRDNAYSPLWQWAKRTIASPLRKRSHRTTGISSEDLRASEKGGYTKAEIEHLRRRFQFTRMVYHRFDLLNYLYERGFSKICGGRTRTVRHLDPTIPSLDKWRCAHVSLARNNTIRLIWGFDK